MDEGIVHIKIANFSSEQVVTEFTKQFDQIEWGFEPEWEQDIYDGKNPILTKGIEVIKN